MVKMINLHNLGGQLLLVKLRINLNNPMTMAIATRTTKPISLVLLLNPNRQLEDGIQAKVVFLEMHQTQT